MSFVINRVYTRSGDDGKTALVGGERVSKADLRVSAYGDIDELNAALGMLKEELSPHCEPLRPVIELLQQELFDLGSELASPADADYPGMARAEERHAIRLEQLCDHFAEGLPELPSFILPGGSKAAAAAHLARTVCRRAERKIVRLADRDPNEVNPQVLKYVNRLSDLLFIAARWILKQEGKQAPLWQKDGDRELPDIL